MPACRHAVPVPRKCTLQPLQDLSPHSGSPDLRTTVTLLTGPTVCARIQIQGVAALGPRRGNGQAFQRRLIHKRVRIGQRERPAVVRVGLRLLNSPHAHSGAEITTMAQRAS